MSTVCTLPWLAVDTLPDGSVSPCCYYQTNDRFKTDSQLSIQDYLDSNQLQQLKDDMLAGKKPSACDYCYQLENGGGCSPRQKHNDKNEVIYQGILEKNYQSAPNQLHLRLSNICDLSCRTCNAFCSTSWNKDSLSLKKINEPLNLDLFNINQKISTEILELCKNVNDLYISGGEPFMDPRMETILASLCHSQSIPKKEINIQTNLSAEYIFQEKYLEKLRKLDSLYLSLSIDGLGAKGEFIRKGLNWNSFEKNLSRLCKELPKATLIITPTISIYNAFHILEFLEYFLKLDKRIQLEFNFVESPIALNPQILPDKSKKQLLKLYQEFEVKHAKSPHFEIISEAFNELKSYFVAKNQENDFMMFYTYSKMLDKLRGENTLDIFPELVFPPYSNL
jgi:MoaA/NifB/PqqE/SkfB family radical SAM enzyme